MAILAPPDTVVVICPVNVLTLLLHWPGALPVAVMAPDEVTVPDVKRMPKLPLVMGNMVFVNTPLATVVVNVPVAVSPATPQTGQVSLQEPV
jgi:hypothetical protein